MGSFLEGLIAIALQLVKDKRITLHDGTELVYFLFIYLHQTWTDIYI